MIKYLTFALTLTVASASPQANPNYREIAGSTLHHFIAEGIMMCEGLKGVYSSLFEGPFLNNNREKLGIIGEITGDLKDIVESILQELGIDPVTVSLLSIDSSRVQLRSRKGSPAYSMHKTLLVDPKLYAFLPKEEFRAIIGHEAMHIKNHDVLTSSILKVILPFVTHFGVKTYSALTKHGFELATDSLGIPKTGLGAVAHTLFSAHQYLVNTALAKVVISYDISLRHVRMSEKRADINSVLTLGTAHGMTQFLRRIAEKQKAYQQQPSTSLAEELSKSAIDDNGDYLLDFKHPPLSERIAYLSEIASKQVE